jgi:hypothetical protein
LLTKVVKSDTIKERIIAIRNRVDLRNWCIDLGLQFYSYCNYRRQQRKADIMNGGVLWQERNTEAYWNK